MNLHPIIVHFPIACLVLYGLLEILLLLPRWKGKFAETKFFLLVVGMIGTAVALQSGEYAEHLLGNSPLIEMHSLFANISYALFGILLGLYLIPMLPNIPMIARFLPRSYATLIDFAGYLFNHRLHLILVIAGLVALTITGALGGAISHGPDTDFMVRMVYNLFIGNQ